MIRSCPTCGAKNRIPVARLGANARCGQCKAAMEPLAKAVNLASMDEFDALIGGSARPVLVDFWAEWCGPCKVVAPELAIVAKEYAGEVVVAKVDTEALPDVAARFAIRSIPTMILFKDGQEAERLSGALPATAIAKRLGL